MATYLLEITSAELNYRRAAQSGICAVLIVPGCTKRKRAFGGVLSWNEEQEKNYRLEN